VATARAVLRETDAMARAQGARAVIVVPQFMPEPPGETYVRRRVLDEGGLSYVLVPMPADWRLSDGHPDPRGAQAIAEALARELTRTGNHAR
jgi:lysophospholipase L1-like esterase